MFHNKTLIIALIALLLVFSLGCAGQTAAPAAEQTSAPTQLDKSNASLTDADLDALYTQTSLTNLDLRGNELSPDAVAALQAALPDCAILWSVPLGADRFDSDSTELVLPAGTTEDELSLLSLFPALTQVDASALTDTTGISAIAAELPNVTFLWNIDVLGTSYPSTTTELDLTKAEFTDVAALASSLSAFPALTKVDLSGKTLSDADMDTLTKALPKTQFVWSVDLYGVSVASDAAEADISGKTVDDIATLQQKLAYLPNLTKLVMCNCGPSNEEMDKLIAAYPNIKFVWIIKVGGWEIRTDIKAFSKGNRKTFEGGEFVGGKTNFTDADIQPLKYCTDLIALDLGHGSRITDLSVLQYMPKLRFLIVAMNKITNIEDLKYCPDLEYLEIFQNFISDWSPLLSLTKLTHLNCSTNYSKGENGEKNYPDYTILKQMKQLQRIWIIRCNLGEEQMADLQAALPNAVINNIGGHSTDNGWRANDLYKEMQGLFNLPISK